MPGTAAGESHLGPTEIEIGMGIHNEPGARRLSPVPPLNDLIPQLVEDLISTTDPDRSFVPFKGKGDKVVLLVNNLGGTSELEMGAVVAEAKKDLVARGVKVERVISGTFMVRVPSQVGLVDFALTYPRATDEFEHARVLFDSVVATQRERGERTRRQLAAFAPRRTRLCPRLEVDRGNCTPGHHQDRPGRRCRHFRRHVRTSQGHRREGIHRCDPACL